MLLPVATLALRELLPGAWVWELGAREPLHKPVRSALPSGSGSVSESESILFHPVFLSLWRGTIDSDSDPGEAAELLVQMFPK